MAQELEDLIAMGELGEALDRLHELMRSNDPPILTWTAKSLFQIFQASVRHRDLVSALRVLALTGDSSVRQTRQELLFVGFLDEILLMDRKIHEPEMAVFA